MGFRTDVGELYICPSLQAEQLKASFYLSEIAPRIKFNLYMEKDGESPLLRERQKVGSKVHLFVLQSQFVS